MQIHLSPALLTSLIPLAIFCLCVFVPIGIVVWIRGRQTRGKKNPLNFDLLRSPGQSLKEEIEGISEKIAEHLFVMFIVPLALYTAIVSEFADLDTSLVVPFDRVPRGRSGHRRGLQPENIQAHAHPHPLPARL